MASAARFDDAITGFFQRLPGQRGDDGVVFHEQHVLRTSQRPPSLRRRLGRRRQPVGVREGNGIIGTREHFLQEPITPTALCQDIRNLLESDFNRILSPEPAIRVRVGETLPLDWKSIRIKAFDASDPVLALQMHWPDTAINFTKLLPSLAAISPAPAQRFVAPEPVEQEDADGGEGMLRKRIKGPPRKQVNKNPETLRMVDELLPQIQTYSGEKDAKASEMFHGVVSALCASREFLDLSNIQPRGRPGARRWLARSRCLSRTRFSPGSLTVTAAVADGGVASHSDVEFEVVFPMRPRHF